MCPHQIPSPYLTKPAKQILARPRDTQPLGGGILYPSHVSTPQHPPIYDDPDLFKIHPVFKDDDIDDDEESSNNNNDEDIEEFETAAYRNHYMNPRSLEAQEWSAKTETRFFPNLGLRNRTFTTNFSKTKLFASTLAQATPEPTFTPIFDATPETLLTPEPITTTAKPFSAPKPIETVLSQSSTSESQTDTDTGMLLNLRPPAEFQSKNKKRNVAETEIVETNFRTNRQSRRSSGITPLKPTSNVEEYETEFQKHISPTAKKENYEKYDTPHAKVKLRFFIEK
uniref:Uncharacterized protein n=1 Tax=Panagrolaimus davidi TaxID=227884 RepID=A0A914QB88_9BILA